MRTGAPRPFCAEAARAAGESLDATASRIASWLIVEYAGYWPYEPLDAAVFGGPLRERLAAHLAATRPSRLLLVKRPGRRPERGFRFFRAWTAEQESDLRGGDLETHERLLHTSLGDRAGRPVRHPLFLVCTHGIRDRCCARYGQALFREVARQVDVDSAWQATHVGGDRFAGNLVVLPEGIYYGRVEPDDVRAIVDAHAAGRIELSRYRGRSCHPFPVQAAEAHVRRATGIEEVAAVRLRGVRRESRDRFTIQLEAGPAGAVHELAVEARLGEPELLTCKAREPKRPRRFVVTSHRELARGR